MPEILAQDQAAEVTQTAQGRYSKEEWLTYLQGVATSKAFAGKTVGPCESDFPGVKPAHVRHVFRNVLKDNAELSAKLTLGKMKDGGVALIVAK